MTNWQGDSHQIHSYGADSCLDTGHSSSPDKGEYTGGTNSTIAAPERMQLFGSEGNHEYNYVPYGVSSIYDDCLNLLNGAFNHNRYFERASTVGSNARTGMDGREAKCSDSRLFADLSLDAKKPADLKSHKAVPCSESVFSCIHSEIECLDLIEGTRKGAIARTKRRLSEREKSMIRPGSIFVYKEQESGIRRWTDKREWTPSRVQGAFLVYKELNGPLYKKTFSKQISSEKYHIVIYSSYGWEQSGGCCKTFGRSKRHTVQMLDPYHRAERYQRHAGIVSCTNSLSSSGLSEENMSIFKFDTDIKPVASRNIPIRPGVLQEAKEKSLPRLDTHATKFTSFES